MTSDNTKSSSAAMNAVQYTIHKTIATNGSSSGIDTNLITLSRHLIHTQSQAHGSGDLTLVLVSLQVACKFISAQVRRAGLANLTGLANDTGNGLSADALVNVQGEKVKKLDVLANDIFINTLSSTRKVKVMVSEENEYAILVADSQLGSAKYALVFDPLDGSSNIEAGVSIGSIFGIYKITDFSDTVSHVASVALHPGKEMVAAGYVLYGSFTAMVLSWGQGTHCYTLDPNIGEFILTQPNVQMKKRGKIYSVNEGNYIKWYSIV